MGNVGLQRRYTYPVTYLEPGVNCLQGPVEDCVRLLKECQAAGATHFVLDPTCSHDEVSSQVETISREILPHFQ